MNSDLKLLNSTFYSLLSHEKGNGKLDGNDQLRITTVVTLMCLFLIAKNMQ